MRVKVPDTIQPPDMLVARVPNPQEVNFTLFSLFSEVHTYTRSSVMYEVG